MLMNPTTVLSAIYAIIEFVLKHELSQYQVYEFDSQEMHELKCIPWMQYKSLWIKVSAECIHVNVFYLPSLLTVLLYPAEPTPGHPQSADAGTATAAQWVEDGFGTHMWAKYRGGFGQSQRIKLGYSMTLWIIYSR